MKEILVVDDHPDAAHIACVLLRVLGHRCRGATTAEAALAALAEAPADIVVIDIGLPDLSGYEVARTLRKRDDMRDAYLVALTGWGTTADRVHALAAGFDQHLLKPADAATFVGIVASADAALAQRLTSRLAESPA